MEWNELSKKEKQSFSEADVCRISITPSIHSANWDSITQIREQYYFIDGSIVVNGNKVRLTFYLVFETKKFLKLNQS